jgi:hypothetical protein
MDATFQAFLSSQFLFFCLGIASLTFVIRKIVDYFLTLKGLKNNSFWNELLLPIMPVVLGVLCAYFAKKYPFTDVFAVSTSSRMNFGLVAGLLSGLVYRIIKGVMIQKLPINIAKALIAVNISAEPTAEEVNPQDVSQK